MERHIITLNPDFGDALFWDEEENLVGHHNVLYLNYEEPNEIAIDLSSIAGLEKWYSKWCEYEDDIWLRHKNVEKDAFVEWCKYGIELSKQIKSLLPDDFDLLFVSTLTGEKYLFSNGEPQKILKKQNLCSNLAHAILLFAENLKRTCYEKGKTKDERADDIAHGGGTHC